MTTEIAIEELLRQLAPQVLAALTRRNGQFDLCEDAVQEALLAAAQQWPADGIPDNPRGWLITVASRRLLDQLRGDTARQRRETAAIALMPPEAWQVPAPDGDRDPGARGRRAHAAVPVLPPIPVTCLPACPDAAGRRRPHDGPGRCGVLRAGGDDGPAHQPREGHDQGRRRRGSRCRPTPSAPIASGSSCTCCT